MREQVLRVVHGRKSVALRGQAGLLRHPHIELPPQDLQLRARLGLVQGRQDLVLLHHVSVMHRQRPDDAALQVLHGLPIVLHRNHPRSQGGALQRGHRGPGAQPAEDQHDERQSLQADRTVVAQRAVRNSAL